MTPYYQDEHVTIWHGDCREILPTISGGALVTDPPFGINYDGATWSDSPEAYPELIRWLVAEGVRLGSWCFIFQAMPNVARFHEWFPEGWRIFAACKSFAQIRPTGVWHSWDPVVFWNSGEDHNPEEGMVNRDYHLSRVNFQEPRYGHPCPRKIDTMEHIVQLAAPTGGLVIDPFMGSGTTLRAAKNTGRRAIGIEINEAYCEASARRMEQGVLPL